MKLTNTIAFRLFLVIATVQALILAALTFAALRVQETHLMDNVIVSANRISDLIVRSTRHSMLLNRKEEVHNIIESIGGQPGIEGLRIYNKQGEVIFAAVPGDVHTIVDMNAEACVSCHSPHGLQDPHPLSGELSRIFKKPGGERVLGMITPIRNEVQCSDAACHAHPADKTILGVLDVKMNLSQVDQGMVESRTQLLVLSVGAVLLISLISGRFIWSVVRRPVHKLMTGMEHVSAGKLDQQLELGTHDELGQLAASFNKMTADLDRARRELEAWSATLEHKVKQKTADLEKAHKQMVRVEKLASLGNLSSTVAHELNNPLEGILTFAKLLIKRINKSDLAESEKKVMCDELQLIVDEAQRSGNIVKNLLVFARQQGGSFQQARLRTVLDRCQLLMSHHAHMHNVELQTICTDDDTIECDPNQIQQALIALMVNAIEAMSSGERKQRGKLVVSINRDHRNGRMLLRVTDTGIGMHDDIKAQMFEPFFTTKSEGKGVGLGLSVVYGIVQRHHGTIDVESTPGVGTSFVISLPVKQPEPAQSTSFEGVRNEQE